MANALLISGVLNLLGAITFCLSIAILYKRTGHFLGMGILIGVMAFAPLGVGLLLGKGYLDVDEFQILFASVSLLAPLGLFVLAIKRWPVLKRISDEVFS